MPQIGHFRETAEGLAGRLHTLTLDVQILLVPVDPGDGEHAPDYRICTDSSDERIEIGAGWRRVGEKAGEFVALLIDDPTFIQPLRANLFQADGGGHVLVWNRASRRDGGQ
jgi:uncharacterized protein (DUF736 family)